MASTVKRIRKSRAKSAQSVVTSAAPELLMITYQPETALEAVAIAQGETESDIQELFVMPTASDDSQPSASVPEALSYEELEALALRLDVIDAQQDAEAVVEEVEAEEIEEVSDTSDAITFDEVLDSVGQEDALAMAHKIGSEIDRRSAYELDKAPGSNQNIQKTIKKIRSQMVGVKAGKVLMAVNIEPTFINQKLHEGSAYNVYALLKLADVIHGVVGGEISNKINVAILKSMFALRSAGVPFTMEVAKAACSKQYRIEASVGAKMTRHTVSPATAPTQSASTMRALVTLGVVKSEGSVKNPTFKLSGNPIVAKLEELLAA